MSKSVSKMFTNYQTFSDGKMTDSKYFTTTKKGEIFELKSELNSDKKERKREEKRRRQQEKEEVVEFQLVEDLR